MMAVADRSQRRSVNGIPRRLLDAVAVAIALLVAGASCSTDDGVVDRLTVVNQTPFDVYVDVSDADKEGWQILGKATHGSSTVNELVRDVGATWVFRFHYGGQTVGELTVEREELRRARWRVEVPSAVADRMRALAFDPSPG
jgi:hypothetical protein